MAFDYGSIDLGIRNPFKVEGAVTAIRGGCVAILGLYVLITSASQVKEDAVIGWILAGFGIFILGAGILTTSNGIIATLRYFVGRNHPTSLAPNEGWSETNTSKGEEEPYTVYTKDVLIEMLVGRKNPTFQEPEGLLARIVHTFFRRLTYMPYPVRNMAQRLFGAGVKTGVALIAYGLTAFVTLAGFAGEIGESTFPIYSAILTIYLLYIWRSVGAAINRTADKKVSSMGKLLLLKVISAAILLPVVIGLILSLILSATDTTIAELEQQMAVLPDAYTVFYLFAVIIGAAITSVIVAIMLRKRLNYGDPKVEVSEMRENWQESVHPNEIFINLDNLVMANRRFKEVPNRVYKGLDPKLNEQTDGKGDFKGEMIQEIQPRVKKMDLGKGFTQTRLYSLIIGNALFLIGSILTVILAFSIGDGYAFIKSLGTSNIFNISAEQQQVFTSHANTIVHLILVGILIRSFARILTNAAHLFYAEMQFESQIIYVKVEGTFTESKISTGTGIHDSTRSENVLVRSSITPWVIVSRIITSTFAASGMKNLEHPRFILEMHKDDPELQSIKGDVMSFLKDRESIAAITSERDLQNASQIHEINQQSRAIPMQQQDAITQDNEAAGYLRQEDDMAAEEDKGDPVT